MHPFFHRFHEAFHHHHHHHHMTRHGHRGFAGFGGRPGFFGGPAGPGFDGLGRGRKLGSADLQLLLLALLSERPSHGYELIKALEERSNGYYAPSPGMVYPALTYLEEIGHASVEVQGAKKLYSITDAGRAHLEGQRGAVDSLLEQLAYIGRRMDEVRRAMGDAASADDLDMPPSFGGRGRGRGRSEAGEPEVRAARRSLKSALVDKAGASAEEQRRIAEILERAANEIRGITTDK
jgi:DNA-binding PadR family transcriptional regulator